MRRTNFALFLVVLSLIGAGSAFGQNDSMVNAVSVPKGTVSLGYTYINANAPPGGCKCFGTNGGFAGGSYRVKDWLSVAGEFDASHANDISILGQDLTLKTFTAGPRVSLIRNRYVPFGQVLFGIAHGSDSYFPEGAGYSSTANSFAYTAGGGLDIQLNHRLAVRAFEAQFLRTGFPNGGNNAQNHLMINAGIVIKLGARMLQPKAAPAPPPQPIYVPAPPRAQVAFSCSTNVVNIVAGDTLEVLGNTMAEPDGLAVNYSWTTTGGTIDGSGASVSVNTAGLAPGRYHVNGHAVSANDPSVSASCEASFRVNAAPVATAAPVPSSSDLKAEAAKQDKIFHENVKDAYFDYDKWDIRPDTLTAIQSAAAYLQQHPDINVLIGGYADERGSSEYNLSLGLKRSEQVRKSLVAAGIDPDRLQVISYGKGSQVCAESDEACWQANRRAAFMMHP